MISLFPELKTHTKFIKCLKTWTLLLLEKRGQKHAASALGAPREQEASVSNVAVSQSDIIEQEETEQEETEEETEQEEVKPREGDQEASISEMLESQLESPHEQLPKRRRMSWTLRSA